MPLRTRLGKWHILPGSSSRTSILIEGRGNGIKKALIIILGLLGAAIALIYIGPYFFPSKNDEPHGPAVATIFVPVLKNDTDDLNQSYNDIEQRVIVQEKDGKYETEARTLLARNDLWMPDSIKIDTHTVEQGLHAKVNSYRQGLGLAPMNYQNQLAGIAEAHATDMGKQRYFSHVNMKDQTPTARGESTGYDCQKRVGTTIYSGIGENLAYTFAHEQEIQYISGIPNPHWITDSDTLSTQILDLWKSSPGHDDNLRNPTYEYEGLGVVVNEHGEIFAVQNFAACQPQS